MRSQLPISLSTLAKASKLLLDLCKKPNGYLYLDMDKTMSVLSKPQSAAISPEASAILNSIAGLA